MELLHAGLRRGRLTQIGKTEMPARFQYAEHFGDELLEPRIGVCALDVQDGIERVVRKRQMFGIGALEAQAGSRDANRCRHRPT